MHSLRWNQEDLPGAVLRPSACDSGAFRQEVALHSCLHRYGWHCGAKGRLSAIIDQRVAGVEMEIGMPQRYRGHLRLSVGLVPQVPAVAGRTAADTSGSAELQAVFR